MIDRAAYLEQILGTPYDKRRRHCWWLSWTVQRDLFGRILPNAPEAFPGRHERAEIIASHPCRDLWHEVSRPADGDMVLMARVPGKDTHCGVYLADHRRILHTDDPHGVVLDTELDLREIRRWRLSYHHPKGDLHGNS